MRRFFLILMDDAAGMPGSRTGFHRARLAAFTGPMRAARAAHSYPHRVNGPHHQIRLRYIQRDMYAGIPWSVVQFACPYRLLCKIHAHGNCQRIGAYRLALVRLAKVLKCLELTVASNNAWKTSSALRDEVEADSITQF
jgi:hypothetical protein